MLFSKPIAGCSPQTVSKVSGSMPSTAPASTLALILVIIHCGAAFASSLLHSDPTSLDYLMGGHGKQQFKFIVATDSHFGSTQGNNNSAWPFPT